jgi:hypothetical protein
MTSPASGTRPHLRGAIIFAVLACASAMSAAPARADDFPVGGSLSVNGNVVALPDGGAFAGATYDPAIGVLSAGAFVFPQGSFDFAVPGLGQAEATYRLSQDNSSSGLVAADGIAALTEADLTLSVLSLSVGGFPIDLGTCEVGPIAVLLDGTASASGMQLADSGFAIPPVAADACGGFADQINDAVAGSDTSVEFDFAGDFSPPSGDRIFGDGFDGG